MRDRAHYPSRLVADTLSIVTRCGVLLLLYAKVFELKGGEINGSGFAENAWSIFLYFAFSSLGLRMISRSVMNDVRSGNVEILFSKPVSYLAYRSWWQIGSGLYPFLIAAAFGAITLLPFVGMAPGLQDATSILAFLLVLIGSALVSVTIYLIVGLMAFWIEDVNPSYWIVDKTIMIMGGSYLPIGLFPDTLAAIARYSPFGASHFITRAGYSDWSTQWPSLLAIQLFWIALLFPLLIFMDRRAKMKVSVNGG